MEGFGTEGELSRCFPQDEVLAWAAEKAGRGRLRRHEGGFTLIFPLEPGEPFPMVPVFCFALVVPWNGGHCVVYRFGADGRPVMPEG